jgi:hypothetical protein
MDALGKLCRHLGLETEIPPLEALLNALPPDLSAAVRAQLTGMAMANERGHKMIEPEPVETKTIDLEPKPPETDG